MKFNPTKVFSIGIVGIVLLAGGSVQSANLLKSATATMNASADWTLSGVNTAPSASNIGEFGGTPTAANLSGMALGASISLAGLQLDNNMQGPLTISAANTLTLFGSGIDMSSANQNTTINCGVTLGSGTASGQNTFTVGNGFTLILAAAPTRTTSANSSSVGGSLTVGTTGTIKFGAAASTLIVDGQGNPYAAFGNNDWAALNSSGQVIAASYTTASSSLTAGVINDITGSFSTGTAIDTPAWRFNDSTARTVTLTGSGTWTPRGILVTANSSGGAISGSTAFIRPNRSSTAGSSFNVIQNSASDFTIGCIVGNASSSTPVSLVKSGSGKLILTGANANSGQTFINQGTLQLGNGGSSGQLGSSSTTVYNYGTFAVNESGSVTIANPIAGNGAVQQIGVGTTILSSGSSTYTGKTTITAGTLSISADANLGANPGSLTADQMSINGGTLAVTTGFSMGANRGITIGASGGIIDVASSQTLTSSQIISGTGVLTKNSAGTLELTVSGSDHTYGGLILNAGTIAINKSSGLGTGVVMINGGAIRADTATSRSPNNRVFLNGDLSLGSATTGPLTFSGAWTITNASRTITVDTITATISGAIGQDVAGRGLTKAGSGTLSLNNTETYTGSTTINAGILALGSGSSLSTSSSISIAAGTTFDVSALATYTLGSGATLSASGSGTTVGSTAAALKGGSDGAVDFGSRPISLTWSGAAAGTDSTHPSLYVSQGTLNLNGNTITVINPGTALAAGTYTLISAPAITGSINTTPSYSGGNGIILGGTGTLSISGNTVILTVVAGGLNATWNTDNDGAWSDATKWSSNPTVPGSAGDTATLGTGTVLRTVTLDADESLGTLNFNNANSFTIADGGKTLSLNNSGSSASVNVTAGTANTIQTAVALNDPATIAVSSGKSLSISGNVSSTATTKTITASGSGTLSLSGNNSYGPSAGTVGTTLSGGGTLRLGNNSALGAGDLSISASGIIQAGATVSVGNNIQLGASTTATVDSAGNNFALNGVISGTSGALTKTGNGTLTLGNANTYYNNTTISAGSLKLGAANTIPNGGSTTGWLILDGGASSAGTLDLNGLNQSVNALSGLSGTVLGQIINNSGSGTSTLTVSGAASTSFVGLIKDNNNATSGKVALVRSGAGALTLSAANTYTGGTSVSGGQLNINNGGSTSADSAIGAGVLTISGGTIDNTSGSAVTLQPTIAETWSGDFTFAGSSALNLGSGTVTLTANRSVTVSSSTLTVSGIGESPGSYSLTKTGSGTLVLNGMSTYSGGTTMSGGPILVNNSYGLGYGGVARNQSTMQLANGVTVTNSLNCPGTDTTDLMVDCPNGSATWAGPLSASGSGGMRLGTSGGTLTLTGLGSFGSRGLIFTYGTVALAGNANFTVTAGTVAIGRDGSGGGRTCSLTLKDQASLSTPANGFGGGKTTGAIGLTIQDTASFSCGTGNFELHSTSSGTAANTINLNGGTFSAGAFVKSDASSGATLNCNGGVLKASQSTASYLPALSGLTVNVGTGGAKVDSSTFDITITQPLVGTAGDGGLTKSGSGSLTLAGAETYTGATAVNNGTLRVNGSLGSSSAVTAYAGALGGTGTINGTVSVNSGATLQPGTPSTIGTLTLGNSLTLAGTASFRLNKTGATLNNDQIAGATGITAGGALNVTASGDPLANGDSFQLFNTGTGSTWFTNVTVPSLASGLAWDTNHVATGGVLDVYNFSTTTLTISNLVNTPVTISAAKLAGHASSSKAASPYPTGWSASASTPAHGTVSFSSGALTYTPATDYAGNDTFTVTFLDGHGLQTMTVNVSMAGQNVGPTITPAQGPNGSFTASGVANTIYTIQLSTDLTAVPPFSDYVNVTSAPNGVINYTDDVSIEQHGGQAYYRLKQYVAP